MNLKIILFTSYYYSSEKLNAISRPGRADILPPDGSGPKGKGDKGDNGTKWHLKWGCVLQIN
jgi:hypothetical protein